MVNHIAIPTRFVKVASRWYDGMDDLLYAVCSTGGLTTGTNCPVIDYTDSDDKMRKWYLTLWRELSGDICCAKCAAKHAIDNYPDILGVTCHYEDYDNLVDFEAWVDNEVIPSLEDSYGLADWENYNDF